MRLNLKDRYRLVKRVVKLACTPDIPAVPLCWNTQGETYSHTFYAEELGRRNALDPIIEAFTRVCSSVDSLEQLNKLTSTWALQVAKRYAKEKNLDEQLCVVSNIVRVVPTDGSKAVCPETGKPESDMANY